MLWKCSFLYCEQVREICREKKKKKTYNANAASFFANKQLQKVCSIQLSLSMSLCFLLCPLSIHLLKFTAGILTRLTQNMRRPICCCYNWFQSFLHSVSESFGSSSSSLTSYVTIKDEIRPKLAFTGLATSILNIFASSSCNADEKIMDTTIKIIHNLSHDGKCAWFFSSAFSKAWYFISIR